MKIKLLTGFAAAILLTSCAPDETFENTNLKNSESKTSEIAARGISSTVTFITETTNHPQRLDPGQSISLSYNIYTYRLEMQGDSNLVLYQDRPGFTRAIWSTNTHRDSGTPWLIAQNDGNLVIYNDGNPLWHTNSSVSGNVSNPHIKMQLYTRSGGSIPAGIRIKLVLGGNNVERKTFAEVDLSDFY